jgi:hypothetical protein
MEANIAAAGCKRGGQLSAMPQTIPIMFTAFEMFDVGLDTDTPVDDSD